MHPFAVIYYMRRDGLMATYHPDFIVATHEKVYLIETKGNDKLFDKNVRQKQTAAVEWTKKINELKSEERMNREWEYVLIYLQQLVSCLFKRCRKRRVSFPT